MKAFVVVFVLFLVARIVPADVDPCPPASLPYQGPLAATLPATPAQQRQCDRLSRRTFTRLHQLCRTYPGAAICVRLFGAGGPDNPWIFQPQLMDQFLACEAPRPTVAECCAAGFTVAPLFACPICR